MNGNNAQIFEPDALLPPLLEAAQAASALILEDWKAPKTILRKLDGSPVTKTDTNAESIITTAIRAISTIPIVAEEEHERGLTPPLPQSSAFFLIDALDGTREFINHGCDFTVNIALIVNAEPVLGVIVAPVSGITWYAAKGTGAYAVANGATTRLCMRTPKPHALTVLAGKRSSEPQFLETYIGAHAITERRQRSSSLKFCLLAQGEADIYARLGPTSEWDTAAGDIILRESGGTLLDITTKAPLAYGKQGQNFVNGGFVAAPSSLLKLSF